MVQRLMSHCADEDAVTEQWRRSAALHSRFHRKHAVTNLRADHSSRLAYSAFPVHPIPDDGRVQRPPASAETPTPHGYGMKDIYLKLKSPDIPGESTDKDHPQWIELTGYHHDIEQPRSASASTAGGHAVGRSEHADIMVVKEVDLASPMLCEAASGGRTFESATIEFFRSSGDGSRVKYLEIQLLCVMVSRVSVGFDDSMLPVETISLRYGAVEWKYTKQGVDGRSRGVTRGAWSLVRNDKTFAI